MSSPNKAAYNYQSQQSPLYYATVSALATTIRATTSSGWVGSARSANQLWTVFAVLSLFWLLGECGLRGWGRVLVITGLGVTGGWVAAFAFVGNDATAIPATAVCLATALWLVRTGRSVAWLAATCAVAVLLKLSNLSGPLTVGLLVILLGSRVCGQAVGRRRLVRLLASVILGVIVGVGAQMFLQHVADSRGTATREEVFESYRRAGFPYDSWDDATANLAAPLDSRFSLVTFGRFGSEQLGDSLEFVVMWGGLLGGVCLIGRGSAFARGVVFSGLAVWAVYRLGLILLASVSGDLAAVSNRYLLGTVPAFAVALASGLDALQVRDGQRSFPRGVRLLVPGALWVGVAVALLAEASSAWVTAPTSANNGFTRRETTSLVKELRHDAGACVQPDDRVVFLPMVPDAYRDLGLVEPPEARLMWKGLVEPGGIAAARAALADGSFDVAVLLDQEMPEPLVSAVRNIQVRWDACGVVRGQDPNGYFMPMGIVAQVFRRSAEGG